MSALPFCPNWVSVMPLLIPCPCVLEKKDVEGWKLKGGEGFKSRLQAMIKKAHEYSSWRQTNHQTNTTRREEIPLENKDFPDTGRSITLWMNQKKGEQWSREPQDASESCSNGEQKQEEPMKELIGFRRWCTTEQRVKEVVNDQPKGVGAGEWPTKGKRRWMMWWRKRWRTSKHSKPKV